LAAIIEILDVAALNEGDNFDIIGGFKSTWRAHAWEGKLKKQQIAEAWFRYLQSTV